MKIKPPRPLPFILFLILCLVLLFYGLFGPSLIQTMYEGKSLAVLNRIIEGRGTVPLEHYLEYADEWAWSIFLAGAVLLLAFSFRAAAGAALFLTSFFLITFPLFCLFEIFPPLASAVHLDRIHYYAYRTTIIPDEKLVFRNRPFRHSKFPNYKGELYSPSYGVDTPAVSYETTKDKDGFNHRADRTFADMVVLGDSYIEYGVSEGDSFSERLERSSGLTAANLGVGNYGPRQYLEVFKEHGLKRKPRYALFCFFAGNDLLDIDEYEKWKQGGNYYHALPPQNFFRRYLLVLAEIAQYAGNGFRRQEKLLDLVDLKLGNEHHKVVFGYLSDTRPPEAIAASSEWRELEKILMEFKALALENGVFPLVVYIPTVAHIYAEYSTEESAPRWLEVRQEQIAAQSHLEQAMVSWCEKTGIELINLTPVFESAAREGKLLYYPFDTHWNSEGREVAARFVAQRLPLFGGYKQGTGYRFNR